MAIRPSTKLLAHIRRRPLVPLLLAATVCVDVVAWIVIPWLELDRGFREIPWLALACGQLGLLAMWSTWRRRLWLWRVLITIAGVLAFGATSDGSPGSFPALATFGGLYAGAILLISLGIRLCVRHYDDVERPQFTHMRFSVAFTLALMTVVAVISALLRGIDTSFLRSHIVALLLVEASVAGVCLALTRKYRNPRAAIVGVVLTVLTLTVFSGAVLGPGDGVQDTIIYGIFLAIAATQYLIWLFAVRVRCTPRWKHKPTLTTDA